MNLNGNYIDLIIILILFYFASEAFRHGFWIVLANFASFLGSLLLSLRFYKYIPVANAIGFLITAIIFEFILGFIFGHLVHFLPENIKKHKINRFLGIIPGIGEGLVIISFLLTLIISLPVKPQIKIDITSSKIGEIILEKTTFIEKAINEVFGGVINDSLTYLTIKSESKESVALEIKKLELQVDEKSENDMFNKINEERKKLAIPELILLAPLGGVARNHAKDMWERSYFSHYSPEGKDVGDRLSESNIKYSFAGENLALAPTVQTAHIGLMNSKGHRENILEPKFKKIGIGVIDNGVYGKMFVEVFTE